MRYSAATGSGSADGQEKRSFRAASLGLGMSPGAEVDILQPARMAKLTGWCANSCFLQGWAHRLPVGVHAHAAGSWPEVLGAERCSQQQPAKSAAQPMHAHAAGSWPGVLGAERCSKQQPAQSAALPVHATGASRQRLPN